MRMVAGGLVVLLGTAVGALPGLAQGVTVPVRVTAAPEQPVPGAQVRVLGTSIAAVTDETGRAELTNVPLGPQAIEVSLWGFNTVTQDVAVTEDMGQAVEFSLVTTVLGNEYLYVITGYPYRDFPELGHSLGPEAVTTTAACRVQDGAVYLHPLHGQELHQRSNRVQVWLYSEDRPAAPDDRLPLTGGFLANPLRCLCDDGQVLTLRGFDAPAPDGAGHKGLFQARSYDAATGCGAA